MKELSGTWELVRTTSTAADGSPMPAPYGGDSAMGLVSFRADGRMVCVLCDSRIQLSPESPREYNSYCGAYTYDGTQLTTAVDASSNSKWFATDQIRDVSFEGELLVLRPPLRAYAAQAEQRTLYWRKIAD
jgi:hypothetical protein